jgi:CRP/FNR family transcriptional regulator
MEGLKKKLLTVFPVFGRGSELLAEEIIRTSTPGSFNKGSFLYSEGDACEGIGFFLEGEVRVYKLSEGGREITLYEIYPGETCILNASCILSDSAYPAVAQALSDGKVLLTPASAFKRMIEKYPEMREFVFGLFSDRLSVIMELIEEVAFGRMDERLIDYLIGKSSDGVLTTTHQIIANDLGTSREVVSRLLKDLEGKGKVSLSRNRIDLLEL